MNKQENKNNHAGEKKKHKQIEKPSAVELAFELLKNKNKVIQNPNN